MGTTKQKKIEDALIKKAVGYDVKEWTEEILSENGQDKVIKKRSTTKHFPPDVVAIKILLSYYQEKTFEDLNALSDEELFIERDKLLKKIQKFERQKE